MTEKLYDRDAYLFAFTAKVLCVREIGRGFAVLLDRTAFFPEGGGQSADKGTIDGMPVSDVREEKDGIWHHMEKAPAMNAAVACEVNFDVRFRRMQAHTGEHILSGIANSLYGCHNVGFHIGTEDMTVDYDRPLTEAQVRRIELLANKAIFENRAVRAYYPEREALAALPYRSKKEIEGAVRLVEVEGIDLCACCAPHVQKTGEVGILHVLSFEKYKGGVRLHIECGYGALEDSIKKEALLHTLSVALSAKIADLPTALDRLFAENNTLKQQNAALQGRLLDMQIATASPKEGSILWFTEGVSSAGMRKFVNSCLHLCDRYCGVFCGTDETGYTFALSAAPAFSLPACAAALKDTFGAKCGGSAQMISGTVCASKAALVAFLADQVPAS